MSGARPGRGWVRAALLAPPVAFLLVFFAWPVANIVAEGLRVDGRWGLDGLGEVLGDARLRRIGAFTIAQATASTALTLLLGLPVAHVLARYAVPGRRLVGALVTVPFVLPTVVVGAAFIALLGARSPFGVDLRGSVWAIVLAHAFFNLAVVVRTVGGMWEQIDPRVEEAARSLGASPWRVWREVTLPLLRPAITTAALVVFLFTATSFGTVLLLGGPGHATLEVEIYRQTAHRFDLPVASVLALIQLAAVTLLLALQARLERRAPEAVRLGPPVRRPLRGRAAWGAGAVLAGLAAFVLVPVGVLVERSLRVGDRYTLAGWRALAERDRRSGLFVPALEAIGTSLRYAAVATVLAVVLGGLAAAALTRRGGRVSRAVDAVLLLPLGTSAVTVGFGFILALDEPVDLRASPWLVPIAQAVVALPFVVRTMTPVLRAIDPRLREAAAVLGAPPLRAWREVDLPIVRRALLVAAGFAFAISLGEFGATSVIARADAPTVPVAIERLLGRPGAIRVTQAFALSTVLMALTIAAVLLVERLRGRDDADRAPGGWW